jgi:hypothetical protein
MKSESTKIHRFSVAPRYRKPARADDAWLWPWWVVMSLCDLTVVACTKTALHALGGSSFCKNHVKADPRKVKVHFGVVDTSNGESSFGDGGHRGPELWFRRVMDSQAL